MRADDRSTRVLVTDGEQRASLAAVRSLGRSGMDVVVCSERKRCLAGRSRFCRRAGRVSSPLGRPREYAREVKAIANRERVDVVLPVTEASLLALLPVRERLEPALVPFGDHGVFTELLDKAEVMRRAPEHGISVPRQVTLEDPGTTSGASVEELRFPVVLKPGRSIGFSGGTRQSVGVTHVQKRPQFEAAVSRQPRASFPLLVQERIEGPGVGIFLLLDGDGVRARFAHRRLREKPPSGGVSVLRESIRPDGELFEMSRSLLEDFGWEGVAMVEFKVSRESGEPFLMEVNPRLWGSLQLAIDAGVDFPTLLVRGALGQELLPRLEYETGIRTRWLWGDVDHMLARASDAIRDEGDVTRRISRLAEAAGEFVSGWAPGTNAEVLQWSDPAPFLQESVDWWRGLLQGEV